MFIALSVDAVLKGFPAADFSDTGSAWMIGLEVFLSFVALLYLRARKFDLASLYPQPTLSGTGLGVAIFFACWLFGAIVVSLFKQPSDSGVIDFSFARMSMAWTIALALVNGTFEEVFLLGVLVRGLRGYGLSLAFGLPLLVRLAYHLYQGPIGALWVTSFGVVLTLAYVLRGDLWPSVFAHALWDIVPTL
jgi:membrane protease YdiL (CAAX protease family)